MRTRNHVLLSCVTIAFLVTSVFAQGPMVPPGAPGPTMKSLDQLATGIQENNVLLNTIDTKSDSRMKIDALPFDAVIPGSYVVTKTLLGKSGEDGITVSANNVTIDLNGHALIGVPPAFTGIYITGDNACIENGIVKGWPNGGIYCLATVQSCIFKNLIVSGNKSDGLITGKHSTVSQCNVTSNTGVGIRAIESTMVKNCVANNNLGTGIVGGFSCEIENCVANNNFDGFYAGLGGVIANCVAIANWNAGFWVNGYTYVHHCYAAANSPAIMGAANKIIFMAAPAGFCITGQHNRIDSNHAVYNMMGFYIDEWENFVVRNSAMDNGENYVLPIILGGGAKFTDPTGIAPIFDDFVLDTPGPWDNFEFKGSIIIGKWEQ